MEAINLTNNLKQSHSEPAAPGPAAPAAPLWDMLRAGSGEAFEQIFRHYYPSLLNYGLRFNKDNEEVKDCIQILFMNIWERKSFLGNSDSIRNYLLASLRRLILKRAKSNPMTVALEDDDSLFHVELSVEMKMIRDQTLKENVIFLQNAIQNLPARQKEALYLRFYNDQSFGEIALIMNISTRAVYKLIYKALDALNEELAPQGRDVPFVLSVYMTLLGAGSVVGEGVEVIKEFM
ncbi:RNA polymerase sigma factor, sigma-70 family [Dyadobacter sp. SG02]|uniref:RNA polymerase sigma factor n=1 Tax=Dyadobacter sp. SG02 TaxID=1855291 RepID=UPI0008D3AF25|nr:sigma-70 family RNA polymerase sigma factor [Dyadobacter sp. SG02]SEJ48870.1 RNA polymerase sigma factor, sigma-70 family [Dyadobacter sp. SG02]